jgi:hypothetical protein
LPAGEVVVSTTALVVSGATDVVRGVVGVGVGVGVEDGVEEGSVTLGMMELRMEETESLLWAEAVWPRAMMASSSSFE